MSKPCASHKQVMNKSWTTDNSWTKEEKDTLKSKSIKSCQKSLRWKWRGYVRLRLLQLYCCVDVFLVYWSAVFIPQSLLVLSTIIEVRTLHWVILYHRYFLLMMELGLVTGIWGAGEHILVFFWVFRQPQYMASSVRSFVLIRMSQKFRPLLSKRRLNQYSYVCTWCNVCNATCSDYWA